MLHLIAKSLQDLDRLGTVGTKRLETRQSDTQQKVNWHENCVACYDAALSGDMVWKAMPAEDVSAAALNAAAAGTFKKHFTVCLATASGASHIWAKFTPVLTPANTVVDTEVGEAVLSYPGGAALRGGKLAVEVTFDTDGGATKTYVSGETVTVDVQVKQGAPTPDDTLFGWPVALATKTYNVVA